MKRYIAAAALAAVAAVPVSQAGAVPPGNTSVPLGSNNGCVVVATPALPGTCNFYGDSAQQGVAGFTTDGYTITYRVKVVTCDPDTNKVNGFKLNPTPAVESSESGTNYIGDGPGKAWDQGIVFTLTVKGNGFAVLGGPGTPSPAMAADPQVGGAPGFAGAKDGTNGQQLGANC